ncbi:hypothetical protein F53441_7709 [Fusarium austroafricanum]|uniref:Uncharacterized protein n=1 Tax=Fusarium austroafricanum TaxID=2364996 RepID=A0A8H4KEX6_9HYPO|nr:hypothetical protein F53441_7709 [Fusarium austroafricanum]
MVSLNQIADAFSEYQYDEGTGFDSINGVPCFACVSEIHRDLCCACVCGKKATTCLYCEHYKLKCVPLPRELLGVAQWYWNTLADLEARDPLGSSADEPTLTALQIGRVRCALIDCGRAWRGLAGHLKNPYPSDPTALAMMALQEQSSTREITSLLLLQASGAKIPLNEIHRRLASAQPAYARDEFLIVALREALEHLNGAENKPLPKEKGGRHLPSEFPEALQDKMSYTEGPAPRFPGVDYAVRDSSHAPPPSPVPKEEPMDDDHGSAKSPQKRKRGTVKDSPKKAVKKEEP